MGSMVGVERRRAAVFVVLMMVALANRLVAQEGGRHVLWTAMDFGIPSGLDEGFSLFPRFGPALRGDMGYDYRGNKLMNEFSLGGGYIWLDSPYGLPKKDMGLQLRVEDKLLFAISPERAPLRFYVGGAVHMNMNFWFPANRFNLSYQSYLGMSAAFRAEWKINKSHSLRAGLSVPVLGVNWRNGWVASTTAVERNLVANGFLGPVFMFPKLYSVHNFQSVTMDLRYTWASSTRVNLYAEYGFTFTYDATARPYQYVDNALRLGVEFKL